ncbi:MAG TPA: chorismate mutase [Candidatus Acidoferrales bacterium]|nr:chorismate mutase [Candidatus Acidoferrales bacterium]
MSVEQVIQEWRKKIDEIDGELVRLLNERSQCAVEVGKLKRGAQLPLYQPDREREILDRVTRANPGPLPDTAIRRLFERILDEARAVERLVMGPEGENPAQGTKQGPK